MSLSAPSGVSAPKANISGYKTINTPNFTPEQMNLFSKLLGGAQGGIGGGLDYLSKLASGDQSGFAEAEAPAYSAFQKSLGQLGSRFGDIGAIGSSGFQNATSGAAQSLAENLGAQRMGIRHNAIQELLGLSNNLLSQKPYNTSFIPEDEGFDWASLLGQLGGGALGSIGGPIGSGIGNALMPKILKLLGLG